MRKYQKEAALLVLGLLILPSIPGMREWVPGFRFLIPMYYTGIILTVYFFLPRIYSARRLSQREGLLAYAVLGAFAYLAIQFLFGVVLKVLKASPYDRSPGGIFFNIMDITFSLAAMETMREYFLASFSETKKQRVFSMLFIILLTTLVHVNYQKLETARGYEKLFIFVAQDVLPVFAEQVLLSIFVFYGGARVGIVYGLITRLFVRLFPFLPELPWLLRSASGLGFPVLYGLFIHETHALGVKRKPLQKKEPAGWIFNVLLLVVVAFSWFSVGVFPLFPSVILTGSMEPLIRPGDMIIIKRIQKEEDIEVLEVGDIINFRRGEINITHRILEIHTDDAGNVSFQTKGDNNRSPDEEIVAAADVRGEIIYTLPKVGLPVLMIRSNQTIPEGVADYEIEDAKPVEEAKTGEGG